MTTLHSNNLQLQSINTSVRNGITAVAGMLVYNSVNFRCKDFSTADCSSKLLAPGGTEHIE